MKTVRFYLIAFFLLITGCIAPNVNGVKPQVTLTSIPTATSSHVLQLESLDSAVTSVLSLEPLMGKNPNRYIVQVERSAFGTGTRKFATTETNMLHCWLYGIGKSTAPCTALQMGTDLAADVGSQNPFRYSYVTFTIVQDQANPNQARVIVYEIFEYGPSDSYWELVMMREGGKWQKHSLTKLPLPFPSTW
jgi:hypothetical protein